MFLGFRSLPIRRPTLLIIRSIVGGHDRSYDRSFMTTTSRTIFSNRCWSRDHAYDQSYDDLPPGRKTDRSMRSLLAIVANIADRSHVRQITTDRTIKLSYDPVWQWLYWFAPCDHPRPLPPVVRPLPPVVRPFYDWPIFRSQVGRNLVASLVWLGLYEHLRMSGDHFAIIANWWRIAFSIYSPLCEPSWYSQHHMNDRECLRTHTNFWRSLCDHCELMANCIRKLIELNCIYFNNNNSNMMKLHINAVIYTA